MVTRIRNKQIAFAGEFALDCIVTLTTTQFWDGFCTLSITTELTTARSGEARYRTRAALQADTPGFGYDVSRAHCNPNWFVSIFEPYGARGELAAGLIVCDTDFVEAVDVVSIIQAKGRRFLEKQSV